MNCRRSGLARQKEGMIHQELCAGEVMPEMPNGVEGSYAKGTQIHLNESHPWHSMQRGITLLCVSTDRMKAETCTL